MVFFNAPTEVLDEIKKALGDKIILSPEAFMEFADKISKSSRLSELLKIGEGGIVFAQAQLELFSILFDHMSLLRGGMMTGGGNAGKLIVGAKGVGKTNAAMAFVGLAEAIWDNVFTIYVDLTAIESSRLFDASLIRSIEVFLKETRNFETSRTPADRLRTPEVALCRALRNSGKVLFLVIDELDQLYMHDDNPLAAITGELAVLGGTAERRIGTLLCGSSFFLPDLIKARNTPSLEATYKLLRHGCANLNRTKFPPHRISPCLPNDIITADAICRIWLDESDEAHAEQVRLIGFATGGNVRFVEQFAKSKSIESVSGPDTQAYGLNALDAEINTFLGHIHSRLVEQNMALLVSFHLDSPLAFKKSVTKGDWLTALTPLTWEDILVIWKKVQVSFPATQASVMECVISLADRSRIILHGGMDGHPTSVYPVTVYRLFQVYLDISNKPQIKDIALKFIVEQSAKFGEKAVNNFFG